MHNHDETGATLEARLRALYQDRFGAPPAAASTWQQVHTRLPKQPPQHMAGDPPMDMSPLRETTPDATPRRRGPVAWVAAVAAFVVVVALAFGIFATFHRGVPGTSHPAPSTGSTATTVSTDGNSTQTLNAVSMASAMDGWAVGSSWHMKNGKNYGENFGLFEHYQNGTWTPSTIDLGVQGEDGQTTTIASVSMLSPNDGWAAGGTHEAGFFFHYDGHTWTRVNAPTGVHGIANVQMLSPTDGWADSSGATHGTILHYDGTAWQVVYNDNLGKVSGFNAMSMISPNEGWAAEQVCFQICNSAKTFFPMNGVILHLQHGQWTTEATFPNMTPLNMSLTPNGDGWLAGLIFPKGDFSVQNAFLAHRHNGHWTVDSSVQLNPASWAGIDSKNGWLGAQNYTITQGPPPHTTVQNGGPPIPLILHYANGTWTRVQTPVIPQAGEVDVVDFSFTSPNDGWAVGTVVTGPNFDALIMHYHNGAWSIVIK